MIPLKVKVDELPAPDTDGNADGAAKPNPEAVVKWNEWLIGQHPIIQHIITTHAPPLNPWSRFALRSDPEASHYFRINNFAVCANPLCSERLHLTLIGFSSAGEILCQYYELLLEDLVPYKWDGVSSNDLPLAVKLREQATIERVKMVQRFVGTGNVHGMISDSSYLNPFNPDAEIERLEGMKDGDKGNG